MALVAMSDRVEPATPKPLAIPLILLQSPKIQDFPLLLATQGSSGGIPIPIPSAIFVETVKFAHEVKLVERSAEAGEILDPKEMQAIEAADELLATVCQTSVGEPYLLRAHLQVLSSNRQSPHVAIAPQK